MSTDTRNLLRSGPCDCGDTACVRCFGEPDTSQGGIDLDAIEARERAATPGPWERGTPWRYAGVVLDEVGSVVGPERGTRCGACRLGEPVWAGLMDVNGTVMPAHRHRNPEPDAEDFAHHVSSAEGGRITGNYDYEIGGILVPEDTEFIAHSREDIPALVAEVRRLNKVVELLGSHLQGGAEDVKAVARSAEAEIARLREEVEAERDRAVSLAEEWAKRAQSAASERDQLRSELAGTREELEPFRPQPMSQLCRDGKHNGVGDWACINCLCLCHAQDTEVKRLRAALEEINRQRRGLGYPAYNPEDLAIEGPPPSRSEVRRLTIQQGDDREQ